MTLLVNSFEGGTAGTAVIGGNSGGASGDAFTNTGTSAGGSITFDNTHGAAHGSLACLIQTGPSAQAELYWTTQMGTQNQVWFRAYLYFAAFPAVGNIRVFYANNGVNGIYCAITTTGKVAMVLSNGVGITTSASTIPLGQWFRVEGYILGGSGSNGQCEVRVYGSADSAAPIEVNTSAATQLNTTGMTGYYFGASTGQPNVQYWIDDVAVSNTGYIGPSAVTLVNSFEGGSNGTSITTSNAGGATGYVSGLNSQFDVATISSGATLQFSNAYSAHGSLSALVACGAVNGAACEWAASAGQQPTTAATPSTVWFRLYMYFAAWPSVNSRFFTVANSSGTGGARNWVTTTGNLLVQDGNGNQVSLSTATVPTGQWFRVEGFAVSSSSVGQTSVSLYTVMDGLTPAETDTSAATQNLNGSPVTYAFGCFGGLANQGPFYMDDIGLSSAGPLGPAIFPVYAQPGTVSPPGFLSPAAFQLQGGMTGFPAAASPPAANAPYLISNSAVTAGASTTATVTQGSGPGDTIVVCAGALNAGNSSLSCSDSRGNVYGQPAAANGNNARAGRYICVNPVPLQPGDIITVTWAGSQAHQGLIAIGLPGAYLGAPGGNLILDASGGATSATASISPATLSQVLANEVALAWVGAYSTAVSGAISWPPQWNVLADATDGVAEFSVGWLPVTTKLSQRVTFNFSSAVSGSGALIATFMPETRFAAQPGLMPGGPVSPPGFLSPASGPDIPPFLPGVINDAPVPGAPYVISASAVTTGASTTSVVTQGTGPGDTIVVFAGALNVSSNPLKCTDSRGNVYSQPRFATGSSARGAQYASVNPVPLQPGDTITISWNSSNVHQGLIAVGLPGACIGQPGGNLITDILNGVTSNTTAVATAIAVNAVASVNEVGLGWVGAYNTATSGAINWPAPWNVLADTSDGAAGFSVGWIPITSRARIPLQFFFSSAVTSAAALISSFMLETRFATQPDTPPGMLSPGSWQSQPGFVPGMSVGSSITPAAITAAVSQPAVTGEADSAASPPALAVAVTQPAAAASCSMAVFPGTVSASSAAPAPAASAGSAPAPVAPAVAVSQPAVTGEADSASAPAAVSAAVFQPAVTGEADSASAPAAVSAAVFQPAIITTTAPAAAVITVSQPAGAASASSALSAGAALAVTVSLPAGAAEADSVTSPAVLAVTVFLPAGAAEADSVTSPAVLAVTVSLPAGVVTASSVPSPVTLSAIVSQPATWPSLAPGTLATTAVQPAVAASAGSTPGPAILACSAFQPAATTSASAAVSLAALACVFSQPPPAAGPSPSPAVLAVTATQPAVLWPAPSPAIMAAAATQPAVTCQGTTVIPPAGPPEFIPPGGYAADGQPSEARQYPPGQEIATISNANRATIAGSDLDLEQP
jgi:hypothetical protein